MIRITPNLAIDENSLSFDFIRASGPGGQNVNKVATAVQLRFDVEQAGLSEAVRRRLAKLAGRRLTDSGVLIIEAKQHRRQEKNRQAALNRLVDLLEQAAKPPKKRRKTRPSRASQERRLANKRRRSEKKRRRRSVQPNNE